MNARFIRKGHRIIDRNRLPFPKINIIAYRHNSIQPVIAATKLQDDQHFISPFQCFGRGHGF